MIDGNFPAILKETSKWTEKCNVLNNNIYENVAENRPKEVLYDGYTIRNIRLDRGLKL